MGGNSDGISRRGRLELTLTALLPAALGLLGQVTARAGRLSWLGPLGALPVGLFLGAVWRRLGEVSLSRGLKEAFGRTLGRVVQHLYLLWGLWLLEESARRYADRLFAALEGEDPRRLFLLAGLGLCLWLSGKGAGALARAGRIFFLILAVTLAAILVLALPAVDWQNLWPPAAGDLAGLPAGAALCLSLSGYGIYALCLPKAAEGQTKRGFWTAWGALGMGALLFIIVGAFGPALPPRMGEPFLFLLEGVQVPGAFRRGEAALGAVLALGDVTLLCLLTRACRSLWEENWPGAPQVGGWLIVGAFLLACLPGWGDGAEKLTWLGNLIYGILLPSFAVFTIKVRKGEKSPSIFCGGK